MWAVLGFVLGTALSWVLSIWYYRRTVGVKPTDRLGAQRFEDDHHNDGGFVSVAI